MSWIKEEDMKEIRSRADIVDIIGQYLALEKKGKGYRCICPFHDDHDPSMQINTEKQIFKCFVCGTGGNVFTFVQKIEKISFPEAVSKVASMVGYPLSIHQYDSVKVDKNKKYHDILSNFIQFTQYELNSEDGQSCLSYLKKRNISKSLIEKFQIGYAPNSDVSYRFLSGKQISNEDLKEVGLLYDETNDYVVFSNRLMIPIHDENGNPVGFTARRLNEDKDVSKYINTPQTILYEKGNLIFNYHRVKQSARKMNRCILVEGAMDVLAYEKAGIEQALACLGTACTSQQIRLLKKLQVPILVAYDGDQAGQNATYKFGKLAVENGLKFQIVQNKTLLDPDELIEKYGKDELVSQLSNTISFVDFLFDYLKNVYSLSNYEDKKNYAQEIYSYVMKCCDEYEIGMYLKRIKIETGFDFNNTQENKKQTKKEYRPVYFNELQSGRISAEKTVMAMICSSKKAAEQFQNEIGFFSDSVCNQLSLYCYDLYRQNNQIDIDSLLSRIEEEDVRNLLVELMNEFDFVYNEDLFNDSLLKIKECALQDAIDSLNNQISNLSNPIEKAKLAMKKNELISQKIELRRKDG
ncbi:DNA primase [Floccifex sp.]|uniref:DNA primase n=1 Tax=Floccifex sp. TaxID=2815810 RepID=UPI002A749C5E|nr:DNA primase [Floccifex sp.]MDD7282046.1 DNA primase [Erysipelotrichaceae bacterium]MDY2958098.1 DNA primase [Floccifex sp.]